MQMEVVCPNLVRVRKNPVNRSSFSRFAYLIQTIYFLNTKQVLCDQNVLKSVGNVVSHFHASSRIQN